MRALYSAPRGVNRSGFEYHAGLRLEREELEEIVRGWGAQVVRLPFNQEWALRRDGYLEAIDEAICRLDELGAIAIPTLQWLRAETRISPLPDEESVELWRLLASRYRRRENVWFDLYTEPHDVAAAEWSRWAQRLVDAVRAENRETPLLISGVDWGYDLRGVEATGEGIIYSTHVYPNKTLDWYTAFGQFAGVKPLFAGEWGGEEKDLAWGQALADYLRRIGAGWTAWSWSDWPHLQRDGQATPFGEMVREELRR
ncbi:MAG: cellulase family glycosylhydrolase [Bryobacteraceae bacterium]|nr:cellulase family glycosylhydrolase [Bryobacteraceae bacterium]